MLRFRLRGRSRNLTWCRLRRNLNDTSWDAFSVAGWRRETVDGAQNNQEERSGKRADYGPFHHDLIPNKVFPGVGALLPRTSSTEPAGCFQFLGREGTTLLSVAASSAYFKAIIAVI